MLPAPILNALFTEQLQQADIAVIEGVMGLYDGYGTDPNYCSSAAMAKQLGCPVILLVDGKAVSTSIAATVMGFQHFDPALDIAGVIVNRVNSDAHFQLLKSAIERYCQVPVLGYVPRVEGVALPERHLGLVTARESVVNQQAWRDFASLLGRTLDIDRLLAPQRTGRHADRRVGRTACRRCRRRTDAWPSPTMRPSIFITPITARCWRAAA